VNARYDALTALLGQRRSCRDFSPEPLGETALEAMRQAFRLAPQAGGGRNVTCSLLTDSKRIRETADAGANAFAAWCEGFDSPFIREKIALYGENFFWFGNAPALGVVTCRETPAYLREAMGEKASLLWGGELSGAMAAFALLLAAESLGIGACCLTGPLAVWREMESRLAVPKRESLVLLIALGARKVSHDG
jgi:nitroreductase